MTGSRLYSLIRFCRKFVIHTVVYFEYIALNPFHSHVKVFFNTLRTGDADLRFYVTTVQDG